MEKLSQLKIKLRSKNYDYSDSLSKLQQEKRDAQMSGNEDLANRLWAKESIVGIHKDFVDMYKMLVAGNYYEAWCKAEQIEISIQFLVRNFKDTIECVSDIGETIQRLQSLYPYKVFASYVVIVQKEKCSICGQERTINNFCGHRVGYVYNGELCINEVTKFEPKGLDIVYNPVHKYSVLFPSDAEGRHDKYDYTLVAGLMNYWKLPFQKWTYKVTDTHKSKGDFSVLTDESLCPCGSGKNYSDCCKADTQGITKVKLMVT